MTWAGGSDEPPPVPLDAALIFAPVGALVPEALSHTVRRRHRRLRRHPHERRAGVPVPAAVGRAHGALGGQPHAGRCTGFLAVAAAVHPYAHANVSPGDANRALSDLREGRLTGAAVLFPNT